MKTVTQRSLNVWGIRTLACLSLSVVSLTAPAKPEVPQQPAFGTLCADGVTVSSGSNASLTKVVNGVMIDDRTKLMWKRCPEGVVGDKCGGGPYTLFDWKSAQAYPSRVTFAGFQDWRLPTRKEMIDAITQGCGKIGYEHRLPFLVGLTNMPIWTSEQSQTNPEYAWISTIPIGSMYVEKSKKFSVRLVRDTARDVPTKTQALDIKKWLPNLLAK
jgi:Protein of unknown function (DUF1566)